MSFISSILPCTEKMGEKETCDALFAVLPGPKSQLGRRSRGGGRGNGAAGMALLVTTLNRRNSIILYFFIISIVSFRFVSFRLVSFHFVSVVSFRVLVHALENRPEDSNARQYLTISKELANKNQVCFAQKVNKLCETSNLNTANLAKNDPSSFLSQIRSSLSKKISEHQLNLIKCNKKLTFYSQFRTDCHKADFLNTINNPIHKKSLNKFRLGNHQLMIEERYSTNMDSNWPK